MGQDSLLEIKLSESVDPQEQKLREQLHQGCRLARELDERLRSIPVGKLAGGGDRSDQASGTSIVSSDLRCSIAMATADVVAAFNEALKLLIQSTFTADRSASVSAASSPPQALLSSPQRKTNTAGRKAINLAVEQVKSPPISPSTRPAPPPSHHTAHRQRANTATPSPPSTVHSPLMSATSAMSDGSPKPNLDLPADEATTANMNLDVKAVIPRKRKLLPKVALKMPAGSGEAAEINTPPDDGHTWRKYGQKDILGAHYPRSYYRCTHKMDAGCPAVKQVQRCDEDRSFFDVIYKGYHTCRSAELDRGSWPLAFPQGLSNFLNFSNISSSPSAMPNIPPAAASFILANMSASAAQINAAHGHHPSQYDSLLAHQFRHVVSTTTTSSAALPFNSNSDLSMSQAFMPSSADLPGGAPTSNCSSYVPLHHYMLSSAQSLVAVSGAAAASNADSAYPNPLFNDSCAPTTQDDRSSNKDHPKGASNYYVGEDYQHGSRYGLENWHELENSNREGYKRLALTASYNEAATNSSSHDEQRLQQAIFNDSLMLRQPSNMQVAHEQEAPPSPHRRSSQQAPEQQQQQQQNDVGTSALAFDTMDNEDLLVYLNPAL